MASQAINNVVNVAIDTVADFTAAAPGGQAGIDDTKLSNGWRCWVTATPPADVATRGLWLLDKLSTALVNNLTVCATFSGVGRYVYFGAGGGSTSGIILFTVTANTAQPAFGTPFTLPVDTTAKVAKGEIVFVPNAGFMQINAVLSGTSLSVVNLGSPGSTTNTIVKGTVGTDGDYGFSATAVPNEAALTALETAGRPQGDRVFVESHKSYWQLLDSTSFLPFLVTNEVIASDDPNKQWWRILEPSPYWTYANFDGDGFTFYISNPDTGGSGDNENDGTEAFPLANMQEAWRRWKQFSLLAPYIVHNLTEVPDSDTVCPSGIVVSDGNNTGFGDPTIIVMGLRTAITIPGGTGIVGGATQSDPSLNLKATLTQAGAVFTTAGLMGKHVVVDDGGDTKIATLINTTGVAAGTVEVSDWYDQDSLRRTDPPNPGSTYQIVEMTPFEAQLGNINAAGSPMNISFVDIALNTFGFSASVPGPKYLSFTTCQLTGNTFSGPLTPTRVECYVAHFVSSYYFNPIGKPIPRSSLSLVEGGKLRVTGSSFINVNVRVREAESQFIVFNSIVLGWVGDPSGVIGLPGDGSRPGATISVDDLSGGSNPGSGLGIFNSDATSPPVSTGSAGAGLILGRSSKLISSPRTGSDPNMIWGINALVGMHVKEGSTVMLGDGTTPTITDVAGVQRVKIDNNDLIPAVDPVSGLPIAGTGVPVTQWTGAGSYSGAPYNRNIHNLKNGTKIISVSNV